MIIDWTNTEVTGISGIRIEMPSEAKISIFTDNDLTHITDDHFEIKLIARLLDQIYVVQLPQSPRYMRILHWTPCLLHKSTDATFTHAHESYLMNKYVYNFTFICIIEY